MSVRNGIFRSIVSKFPDPKDASNICDAILMMKAFKNKRVMRTNK